MTADGRLKGGIECVGGVTVNLFIYDKGGTHFTMFSNSIKLSLHKPATPYYRSIPSNVLSSTYFLGKTFFFSKICLGDPPLIFLEVCLKFRSMER